MPLAALAGPVTFSSILGSMALMMAKRVNPILNVSNIRVREMHLRHADGNVFRISQSRE